MLSTLCTWVLYEGIEREMFNLIHIKNQGLQSCFVKVSSRSVENCRFWSTLKMVDFKLFSDVKYLVSWCHLDWFKIVENSSSFPKLILVKTGHPAYTHCWSSRGSKVNDLLVLDNFNLWKVYISFGTHFTLYVLLQIIRIHHSCNQIHTLFKVYFRWIIRVASARIWVSNLECGMRALSWMEV